MRPFEGNLRDNTHQQNLFKNLDANLKASLKKIQRYCEEYPEWQSGRKLIPTRESVDPWSGSNDGKERTTTAQVCNNNATNLLGGVAAKVKQCSPSNSECLRIEGPSEPTPLISFNYDESKPLVMFVPNQAVVNPKVVLTQYVAFAEAVDDASSKLFGELWSKDGDHVRFWFEMPDRDKEYSLNRFFQRKFRYSSRTLN